MAHRSHKASTRLYDAIAENKTKYIILTHDRCPKGTEIRSRSECNAAAAYLNLADTAASSFYSKPPFSKEDEYDYYTYAKYKFDSAPRYCFEQGGSLLFNSGSYGGSCSRTRRCLCKASLPGVSCDRVGLCLSLDPKVFDWTYLTFIHSNIDTLLDHGRCPKGTEIRSVSECSKAAFYANLTDTSAVLDEHPRGVTFDPPFCYYEDGQLKFNAGKNTGFCSKFDQCLCARETYGKDWSSGDIIKRRWESKGWEEEEYWERQRVLEDQKYRGKSSVANVSRPPGITCIIIICIF